MSKTTFQIPMCALVPVFKCLRGCVRVSQGEEDESERGSEEERLSNQYM